MIRLLTWVFFGRMTASTRPSSRIGSSFLRELLLFVVPFLLGCCLLRRRLSNSSLKGLHLNIFHDFAFCLHQFISAYIWGRFSLVDCGRSLLDLWFWMDFRRLVLYRRIHAIVLFSRIQEEKRVKTSFSSKLVGFIVVVAVYTIVFFSSD